MSFHFFDPRPQFTHTHTTTQPLKIDSVHLSLAGIVWATMPRNGFLPKKIVLESLVVDGELGCIEGKQDLGRLSYSDTTQLHLNIAMF